jgi:uncharacterized protein
MTEHPALLVLMIAVGSYMLALWRQDYRAYRSGQPNPRALPGATPAPIKACVIAAAGAVLILGIETWGEVRLGLSDQQSKITVLFGLYTLIAAFIEELIFRGFIVIEGRGPIVRWSGVVGASLLFAALHPFLWKWEGSTLVWTFTPKAWFSTATVFISSLWFYVVRFMNTNSERSLIPSIVAHSTKNLGVFAIKGFQGFVTGWW